jgi:uncharacterized protein YraI
MVRCFARLIGLSEEVMTMLRAFLYVLIATLALPLFASDFNPYIAESSGDSVRVRSGPSLAHPPIHVLAKGDEVVVVDEADGWVIVRLPEGAPCWIASEYVEISGAIATVTGDNVNLRIEAATRHFPVGQAERGQKLRLVLNDEGKPVTHEDFVRVVPPHQARGAIAADLVAKLRPVTTEELAPAAEEVEEAAESLVPAEDMRPEPTAEELEDERKTFAELERLLTDELKKPAADIRLVNIRKMFEQFHEIALSNEIRNKASDYIRRIDATLSLIEAELARVERESAERTSELERIRKEAEQIGKEPEREAEPEGPVEYIAIGTVGRHGRTARTPASHRLFDDEGKILYDLRWDDGDLTRLMGSRVGIVGEIREYEGWPHKVIVITRIEVIDDGEEK